MPGSVEGDNSKARFEKQYAIKRWEKRDAHENENIPLYTGDCSEHSHGNYTTNYQL